MVKSHDTAIISENILSMWAVYLHLMNPILYLIPTAVLVATVLISRVVKIGFGDYVADLERKVSELEGILNLTFMRELLNFFVSSKASEAAEKLVSSVNNNPENAVDSVSGAARISGKDVENLYSSMKKAIQPSIDLERVRFVSGLIYRIVLIYGLSISAVMYAIIAISGMSGSLAFTRTLLGAFFGVTIIFSIFLVVIVLDLTRYSGRIRGAMKKLSGEVSQAD